MSIKVALKHSTRYEFDKLVHASPHIIRLRPAPHTRTQIDSYSLKIEPSGHFINWQQDPFGNYQARIVFPERIKYLSVDVEVIADMVVINPFDFFLEEEAMKFPFQYEEGLLHDLTPYLVKQESDVIYEWLDKFESKEEATVDFIVAINNQLNKDIKYNIRMEEGVQSCKETLTKASGSCRDSAWLLVQIFRHLGLASRFVSGYLVQLTSDIKSIDGPSGPEQDFTDLHAWTEVYLPGAGWVGLDPTSGLFAGEGHIPLACTPDYSSASPVTGAVDPCETEFTFSNDITRVHETPRVTKPYSDEAWVDVMKLGEKIQTQLDESDVRLTMGGEPTFVSIDDMQGAEWNTEALGEAKLHLSEQLFDSLFEHFAQGGLKHFGQGKWYPGEPLPRWALNLYWRKDGKALWNDKTLLADKSKESHHNSDTALEFINTLAKKLGITTDYIQPAFEDVYYNLWKEGKLPVNVDPFDNKLEEPIERDRLRRLFEQGLDSVVGYALPLRAGYQNERMTTWQSCNWEFRRGRMYLLPGDSPMGFRLPLQSIQYTSESERELEPEADPFSEFRNLPEPFVHMQKQQTTGSWFNVDTLENFFDITQDLKLSAQDSSIIYTGLCAEIRDNQLHIFLPPLVSLDAAVNLIATIEEVSDEMQCQIIIEGYPLPKDDRLELLQITPDPGVIEVNVHPVTDWKSLVENTEALYSIARECRLGTEKFMLDGRHTGTGGGNHVTLGGVHVPDSPFLRKPDLLGSLIRYWQNHPSLSYLFSGLFIGPTSQAPRVDEARDDNLYELEIALNQLFDTKADLPWLVDRILRNCLVDLTGNTHRAEFCVDKLYSPDSASGRRGLVELRAFEMPPHSRMSMVQMLLIRGLIARFWNKPYTNSLVAWGTTLHDRFMLPHFVWQDFKDVISDMQNNGLEFDPDWFSSFYEFRFPKIGDYVANDIQLELRNAIEPWNVLGEESSGQATARYVDSSIERVEVKVTGLFGDRYTVTCNGRKLPLRETGVSGEYVAGVRFKAWNPPSSLHPTVQANDHLVFDVVDLQNKRSVGGCSYFVSHPGGRNSDIFPVNANEAEARRFARFAKHGHEQGDINVINELPHPAHPLTLDLRYRPKLYFKNS